MKLFRSSSLHDIQNASDQGILSQPRSAMKDSQLMRFIGGEPIRSSVIDALDGKNLQKLYRLAEHLFLEPTCFSRDLAIKLGLQRQELLKMYQIIKSIQPIQNALTFGSPLRRRVSFLRRELLPDNISNLKRLFNNEVCLPNHVEFHPALVCNLRCKACPNCQSDHLGDWQFLDYPNLGQPLNIKRLRLIQNLFLDMGVKSFSFGGGGEPSLSELTLVGISHLRETCDEAEIFLYTNGIFPSVWQGEQTQTLVKCLNKIRFSVDASNAQEWSQYKGRSPELFELLWGNIGQVVAVRDQVGGITRIGASCLVTGSTYRNVEVFLDRARTSGLDFCDIKGVETCFGKKSEDKTQGPEFKSFFNDLMAKIRSSFYSPMDVVVDDSLLSDEVNIGVEEPFPTHCWVAIRGRMLTVGPYGELYPCSDAANPGAQERRPLKNTIGQLSAFDTSDTLKAQFSRLWADSLDWRMSLSRDNCAYCVPSHTNYNLAVEKLFEDWKFGIMPEDQPFAGVPDHYLASRGAKRS